jgi:hypothetical protein
MAAEAAAVEAEVAIVAGISHEPVAEVVGIRHEAAVAIRPAVEEAHPVVVEEAAARAVGAAVAVGRLAVAGAAVEAAERPVVAVAAQEGEGEQEAAGAAEEAIPATRGVHLAPRRSL